MDDLERALRRVSSSVSGRSLEAAVNASADVMKDGMETRAPRDRGDLELSIEKALHTATSTRAQVDVGPGRDGFHGMFQELGTVDMAPQPFMRPTYDEDGDRAVQAFVTSVQTELPRG